MSAANPFNFVAGLILELGAVIAVLAMLLPLHAGNEQSPFLTPVTARPEFNPEPPLARPNVFRANAFSSNEQFEQPRLQQRFMPATPQYDAWADDRLLPPAPAAYEMPRHEVSPRNAVAQPRIREFSPATRLSAHSNVSRGELLEPRAGNVEPSYRLSRVQGDGFYDRY